MTEILVPEKNKHNTEIINSDIKGEYRI